jgi:hypothetical protein
MGGEIVAVTGSQSPALLSSARRSVLDRATAPRSSALRNPDTRWGSRGDLRPLMGAEVVTPEEPHPTDMTQQCGRLDVSQASTLDITRVLPAHAVPRHVLITGRLTRTGCPCRWAVTTSGHRRTR